MASKVVFLRFKCVVVVSLVVRITVFLFITGIDFLRAKVRGLTEEGYIWELLLMLVESMLSHVVDFCKN